MTTTRRVRLRVDNIIYMKHELYNKTKKTTAPSQLPPSPTDEKPHDKGAFP